MPQFSIIENKVLSEGEARNQSDDIVQPLAGDINVSMEKELEHFRMVFKQNLSIQVTSSIS
ncbi:hypothetical protein Pfo_006965 [Paulownia fortunei]|nr:hypothetical protein Pfo_006965 [Paulownia fortunei]